MTLVILLHYYITWVPDSYNVDRKDVLLCPAHPLSQMINDFTPVANPWF